MLAAALPVTSTSRPVPATAAGMTSSRRAVTRSVVASSWGAVVGMRFMTYASGPAASSGNGGVTAATPRVRASVRCNACTATPVSPGPGTAVTTSGPLNPGPKPSASRS
jgi:hypothetical protein